MGAIDGCRSRALFAAAWLAASCGLSSCKNMGPRPIDQGREWFTGAFSGVSRNEGDSQRIDDAGAFTLEGGYDLFLSKHARAGFEGGFTWSSQDVAPLLPGGSTADLDVYRWNLGGRASLALPALDAVLYVNGGVYLRDEDCHDEPGLENSGHGPYYGAGLDFWFDRNGRMGPFVRSYELSDGSLRETLFGLSITFYP